VRVRHLNALLRPNDPSSVYELAIVNAGKHEVQVSESPTGRSVRVYVGHQKAVV
jgi:hypothetical protein